MAQLNQIGKHATTISTIDGVTSVVYHSTAVVRFDKDKIVLNSNGWHTQTTKNRMNQTSHQFGLGYRVYQKDYEWFVEFGGEVYGFADKMTLEADGSVTYA
ncbi:MAG: hypothetical protein E3J60_04710 [Dehalococcoidia bacterium]|nr:MAG: hypothetical protein E3J60_04710 [Dehalococcoidia bacterium]